jgi:hypothetical protein
VSLCVPVFAAREFLPRVVERRTSAALHPETRPEREGNLRRPQAHGTHVSPLILTNDRYSLATYVSDSLLEGLKQHPSEIVGWFGENE